MAKKLSILLFLGLVTFTLWRNYGVVAKGDNDWIKVREIWE